MAKPGRVKGSGNTSFRDRAMAAELVEGHSEMTAGQRAEFRRRSSARNAFKTIALRLAPLMDKYGLTEESILQRLKSKLDASKIELAQHEGKFTDILEVADNGTQWKALETAIRLRRMMPEREYDDGARPTVAVQIITNVTLDEP